MKRIFIALKVVLLISFVLLAHHFAAATQPGARDAALNAKWKKFSSKYQVTRFGTDGYFVRAVRNGHDIVNQTYQFAWRFTRRTAKSRINSCSQCHTPEYLAYSFVNSDRFVSPLGKRVSFEENIMRCYVKHLDGFVPTVYDPAVRDIRIYARMVAHDLALVEGTRRPDGS